MVLGVLVLDLLLGDVHSLKEKRSVVRPVVAALKRLDVSVAETGELNLHRRAEVSVAVVAPDHAHVHEVLSRCEAVVGGRPEVEIVSVRRRVLDDDDLD